MTKKIKILTLGDHPLSPSGVGTQTKYFIESLLKTGRYEFVCLGGAVKHRDYSPQRVDPWGDNWRIFINITTIYTCTTITISIINIWLTLNRCGFLVQKTYWFLYQ